MSQRRTALHRRVMLAVFASGAVPFGVLVWVLLAGNYSPRLIVTALVAAGLGWLAFAYAARSRVVHQLQTLSALLSALREGDFSIRARGTGREDPLGDVHAEINTLADTLRSNRLEATEATALLRRIMEELSYGVFATDAAGVLVMVNPAGAALLGRSEEQLKGRLARDVGLARVLEEREDCAFEDSFPGGGAGRWCVKRHGFRLGGLPHLLYVVSNLSAALREEEVQAWQKLVRVLGHELNNSLAPVKSLAGSLLKLASSPRRAPDWEDDLREGLGIIESRAGSLTRFMAGYAQLARLPKPDARLAEVEPLVTRVVALDFTPARTRSIDAEGELPKVRVQLDRGPEVSARMDVAQIEQVLINLLKNAFEAVCSMENPGPREEPCVRVGWTAASGRLRITVQDCGPGIANAANLFVPFFTTKEKGSGIGLVLCRQIVENHGGRLTLENRPEPRHGVIATVELPL